MQHQTFTGCQSSLENVNSSPFLPLTLESAGGRLASLRRGWRRPQAFIAPTSGCLNGGRKTSRSTTLSGWPMPWALSQPNCSGFNRNKGICACPGLLFKNRYLVNARRRSGLCVVSPLCCVSILGSVVWGGCHANRRLLWVVGCNLLNDKCFIWRMRWVSGWYEEGVVIGYTCLRSNNHCWG